MENQSKKRHMTDAINLPKRTRLDHNLNMFCWGSTVHGELGLGGIEDENIFIPREVDFVKSNEIEQIACGNNFTIVLTKNGELYSCGNNDFGQLGHEKGTKRLQLIPGLKAFVFKKVACGASFTVVVNEWGQLFSWGCNADGQLGLNTTNTTEHVPHMIKTLGTHVIVQIACGVKHTIALTNDGELYAWGSNNTGQLGLGPNIQREIKPKQICSLAGIPIAFIACGGYHTIVISKSGGIFTWGKNTFGQLGLNDTQTRYLPCQLRTLRNVKVCYAACGEEFTTFLTLDGGVFTCGAGMYGQLGHGSNVNEILPRQVMELMGSTVTQIVCGARHTLALVPSRGKIYAWGLGGAGQLGNRVVTSGVAIPQTVTGPWVSSSASSIEMPDCQFFHAVACVVKRIFSGGDHCFAIVTMLKDKIEPDDCRILDSSSQILTLTEEKVSLCEKLPFGSRVGHELLTYIETVFRSQACLNASFLLCNDEHYGCGSKHHGVDMDCVIKLYGKLAHLKNNTVKELIFTCVTDNLIPSLVSSPPDVECLRIYLTLPLYHGFIDLSHLQILQQPFCKAVLNLKAEALKIVGMWWSTTPSYYFERIIRIYKAIVFDFVKQPTSDMTVKWSKTLEASLNLLRMLYKLNYIVEGSVRVPYDTFHLSELMEYIDIRNDYLRWLSETNERRPDRVIFFCDYPFLFNAQLKTVLLETDQAIQMQSAMNEAATRAIRHILFNGNAHIEPRQHNQFITLDVSRHNIAMDTIKQLSECNSNDLKKPLKIKFRGEEAEDAGGLKKEFFMLLLREILDPKYGMFKEYDETRAIWFSQDTFEDENMYFLVGLLCGLAIYNFIIIHLPFPLALYKKLLNEPVVLSDMKGLSPTIARSMQDILDYNDSDFEDVFNLSFEVSRNAFGQQRTFELIPDGGSVNVTLANKHQYVQLYVDYVLNKSVASHFKAFHNGFHKVCGGRVLQLFHSQELMAVVIGNENYDWKEFEKNTYYREGYSTDDPTIILFWKVFHELSLTQKKKFLLYLTGSDRIPIQGMKAIRITIQPMSDDRFLPVAHTCFNLLDLPRYQTREKLRYKLLQAIQQTEGFSLV